MGGGQEDIGQVPGDLIKTLVTLFYANDELVASPESASLQGALDILIGLFDRVDL